MDPATAKLVHSEALPEELRRVFPEGFIEGTIGALLADFLQNHAIKELSPRGYLNYRNTTRAYLAPVLKIPILQFGEDDVRNPSLRPHSSGRRSASGPPRTSFPAPLSGGGSISTG